MDSTGETDPQNGNSSYFPHPTDPDGVVVPPPTTQQMAEGKLLCKVYERLEWGGRLPRETGVMYTPVTKVMISRTETEACFTHEDCRLQIKKMQSAHMDEEGEPDIKYHFLVGGDGALYEGRGYTTVGASYPITPNNLQELSKNCLEIALILSSDQPAKEEMLKAASDCITLGRHANHIYKTFDIYFVANNDIVHVEKMGIVKKEENRTPKSDEKNPTTETSSEAPQQSSSIKLNLGESRTESSSSAEDKKQMNSQNSSTDSNSFEDDRLVETVKDKTDKPEFVESEAVEFPTSSNVPDHDSSDIEETKDKEEEKAKPVNIVYRHLWGAQRPKWIKALNLPINKVAVSFTESDPCFTQDECIAAIKKLQEKHMTESDEPDIKHNFLIGGDGQIYEGRGFTRVGPLYPPSARKIEELNEKSIDIGIIEKHAVQPSDAAIDAISWCVSTGIHQKYINKNFDTYYIANNEIIHIQHPVEGAEHKT